MFTHLLQKNLKNLSGTIKANNQLWTQRTPKPIVTSAAPTPAKKPRLSLSGAAAFSNILLNVLESGPRSKSQRYEFSPKFVEASYRIRHLKENRVVQARSICLTGRIGDVRDPGHLLTSHLLGKYNSA